MIRITIQAKELSDSSFVFDVILTDTVRGDIVTFPAPTEDDAGKLRDILIIALTDHSVEAVEGAE